MIAYFFQSYLHITSNVATKFFSLIQPFVFIIEPCTVCFRTPWILSSHVVIDTRNCKKGVIFLELKFSLIPQAQTCEMFDQYLNEHLLLNHYSVDLFKIWVALQHLRSERSLQIYIASCPFHVIVTIARCVQWNVPWGAMLVALALYVLMTRNMAPSMYATNTSWGSWLNPNPSITAMFNLQS